MGWPDAYLHLVQDDAGRGLREGGQSALGNQNGVHWMLDVNFREDAATVRKDHAAENLSRLKRIVLNLLKVETATASSARSVWPRNASRPLGTTSTG
jgi:predicted transposase YbfD/YdcC